MKGIRFCRNPAPGIWFLLDFPSRKFGKVFIYAGKWYLRADNGFFGQLPGKLSVILSFKRLYWHYAPDEPEVKRCLAWMNA